METSIPIYIINLKRNPERKIFMQRQLDALNLNYQFVDAIDKFDIESSRYRAQLAQSLNIEPSALEYKYSKVVHQSKTDKKYKDEGSGRIACLLSHIKTYNLMHENNDEMACVLEDDAILLPTFREVLNIQVELEWDILLLASLPLSGSIPFSKDIIQRNYKHIRFFNKDLLFISRKIKNDSSRTKQEYLIKRLLDAYGLSLHLYPKQSSIMIKALQDSNALCAEMLATVAPENRRFSIVKHRQYIKYKTLCKCIKVYTLSRFGALPEKPILKISDHHCIAKPKLKPISSTAYLLKREMAMKWVQYAFSENLLAIDEIPWELYKNEQVKLRLITPPYATTSYHYLIYSCRRQ